MIYYLLETGTSDKYLLEDGSGFLLIEEVTLSLDAKLYFPVRRKAY